MSRRTTLLLSAVIVAAGLSIPRLNPPAVAIAQSQPQATGDDEDQDGVPDSWESNGVSITTLSGKKWLDLKGDKASPTAKDVYVWVDWMNASAGHNHRPQEAAIQLVKDAFAAHNIGLHVFYADKYFNKPLKEVDPLGSTADDEYDWSEFDKRRDERFPKELHGKFHYALFAHLMGGREPAAACHAISEPTISSCHWPESKARRIPPAPPRTRPARSCTNSGTTSASIMAAGRTTPPTSRTI